MSGRTSCRRRGRRCWRAVAGCDGILTLLTDRVDDALLDAAGARAQGRQQLRGRVRQHRCRGVRPARDRGRQHAGRPDRDDGRPGLGVDPGRVAPRASKATATCTSGRWRTWGPMLLMGSDIHGATLGVVGLRADRPGGRPASGGLRDDDPVQLAQPGRAGDRDRAWGDATSASPNCSSASDIVSLHVVSGARHAWPHRRRGAGPDEADGRAGQHVPWPGRGPGARWPPRCATG